MNTPVTNQPGSPSIRNDLKRDFSSTLDDAEDLVRMTAGQSGEQVTAARNRVKESLEQARLDLQHATERARRAAYEVDDYVHTNPWKTMALAVLLGAVVGLLIARR